MRKLTGFLTSRMFVFFALIGIQAWFWVWVAMDIDQNSRYAQSAVWVASMLLALWITQKHENAAYKIGWLFVLLVQPLLGIMMYLFFSQRPLSRVQRYREHALNDASLPYMQQNKDTWRELKELSGEGYRQSRFIYHQRLFPVYRHTATKYYPMGQYFFEDLVKDLKQAEKYIYMEYFIIEEGVMLDTVLDILEEKAKAGLDVRFMYDDFGCVSKVPHGYYKKIRARGIQCEVFNPLRPVLNSMFNNRDHRKITVIDGRVGYCSGANLADEYINVKHRFGTWKDEAIRLEGEGVWSLLMIFLRGWLFASKKNPVDFTTYIPERPNYEEYPDDGFVQPFTDSPTDSIFLSRDVYLNMINKAERYVYINTPYLDVGDQLVTALQNAARSGVDVRITVPHIPDKKVVFLLTQSYFPDLIEAGVKIYEYTPGFIHSKTFVCDDTYGVIGTINMDFRSLFLHWEAGVWLWGTSCLKTLKEDYLKTCEISEPISYAMTQDKNVFVRFFESVLQVFGPLM